MLNKEIIDSYKRSVLLFMFPILNLQYSFTTVLEYNSCWKHIDMFINFMWLATLL